jgi:hypothetical protein
MGEVRPSAPVPSARVPRHVYWRRRIVVLAVPVVLVLLVVWFVGVRGEADEPSAGATRTSAATPKAAAVKATAKPTAKATAKGTTKPTAKPTAKSTVPDCSSLDLDVSTDAKSYDAGANPKVTTTVTNTGAKACLVDAGTAEAALVITSGDDEVWSSQHCASKDSRSKPLLLSAGKSVSESVTWVRVRSAEGCPAKPRAAKAGTYAVTYSLAGQNAPPAVIHLR